MGWRTGARKGSGPLLEGPDRAEEVALPTSRNRSQDDLTALLRRDRVFAFAQVTLLVKIILTVVLFDPRSFDTFTLPKSVAAHSTSLILAALLVWLTARYGRSILFWSPVHLGVGLLLISFAVATPFALDPTIALFGTFKRYLGLTQMLDNVVLYAGVVVLFRDVRSLRLLALVSIGVGVPVLAYALVQRLELDPLRFVQATTRVPISTLGNPDIAGAFVSVIGITALGVALLMSGPLFTPTRGALLLIGIGSVSILYATGVRAGVLAIGAGWLATIALSAAMPGSGPRRRSIAVGVAALLAVLVSPIGARLDPTFMATDRAVVGRLQIWSIATQAVSERPVLGFGPDNFAAVYPSRRPEGSITVSEGLENSTHDVWLYVATSAGVVGVAALVALVSLLALGGWRLSRAGHPAALAAIPLAAYLGQALVGVNEIAVDWIFWVAAGVIAAGSARPIRSAGRGSFRSARVVGWVAVAAAVAAIVGLVAPRVAAGEGMLASEAFAAANRGREAVPYGETAVSADPRRAEHWSSYGGALYRAGDRPAALAAYNMAARVEPWHPLSWMNLAIVWNDMGNTDAAFQAVKRAVAADPYDGVARELLAQLSYERGDFAGAVNEGLRAISYELRDRPTAFFTTISAYVQLKDLEHAEALAREAVLRFNTIQLRLQLAAILADEGKTQEAVAVLDALLRDQPANADAQRLRDAILRK
jgi:O-antigen ligase/Flp pilus assembly protein TadD